MTVTTNYRTIAFEHHGRECAGCGTTEDLHVHHKDRDRTNNDPQNLQVLCKDCHWDQHRDELAERASGPQKNREQTYGKTEEYREKVAERMSGPRSSRKNGDHDD